MQPPNWKQVEQDKGYQSLDDTGKQAVKQRYFSNVVSKDSDYQSLDDAGKKTVQDRFFNGPSKPNILVDAAQHIIPSGKNFVGGVAQAVTHPVKTIEGLGLGVLGLAERIPGVQSVAERINPDVAKQAMDAVNAIGGMYKERYGSLKALESTFRTDPVGFAADLSTLAGGVGMGLKAAGAAGTAAKVSKVAGILNPLETSVHIGGAIQKGANALAGAGVPKGVTNAIHSAGKVTSWMGPKKPMDLAAEMTAKGVGVGMNALNPKAKAWLSAVEGVGGKSEGRNVVDKIRQGDHEIVPGSKPTVAEAVSDLKLTKLSQFDQAAKKHLSTEAARRQMTNEAAQMEHVGKVAKTEDAMKVAETARETVTGPMYDAAKSKVAQADDAMADLLKRPSMDDVMSRAKRIAKEQGKDFQIGENLPERTLDSKILDSQGRPVQTTIPAEFAKYTGDNLHTIKMAFDDLINDTQKFPPGIKSKELSAIRDTRSQFVEWIQKTDKIPEYKAAREKYAEMSKPIDRMKVGQYIEGKVAPTHGEDAGTLRSTVYENALNDAPGTVKKSTGQSHIKKLEDILTPNEMNILNGVRDDIRRSELSKRLAKFGKGNDPDIKKMATDAVGDAAPPPLLNPIVTIGKAVFSGLKEKMDHQLAIKVATELLAEDLNIPAAAIEKALAHELKVRTTKANVEKTGKKIGAVIRTPAVYNMLSPNQQESQNALTK